MSKKLLLADDSITIQKVIQITFAHEDYELTITDNGDAALAKAQEIKPDLVMSDVYMPGKNGYELTSAIKQDPALQNVPVLLLAGSFEPFDEDKARSCKADAWIEKPFESQSLIDKVAELLSAVPQAEEAPAVPTAEPVAPVAEPPLEPVAELPVDETPLAAFDEPLAEEPAPAEPAMEAAPAEDPFGDISFEEEIPAVEPGPAPAPASMEDDWSDVSAEPESVVPAAEDVFAAPAEPIAEEPAFAVEDASEDVFATDETPVAEAELDVFDMGEDEIMPLGDDDILGAEDLEPAPEEPTLAAWSRDSSEDDVFGEPIEDSPLADEDVFAQANEPVMEVAATDFAADEPVAEVAFEEPVAEAAVFEDVAEASAPVLEETPPVFEEAPVFEEEAPAVAAIDVEAKAASMNEAEIEQVIEKVVEKVVEKLAGSILEKVAWEVVPDMAENLIREEIRKIKDAAA